MLQEQIQKKMQKSCFFDCQFALFKTAMAGSDSNWGRIIMAIGKSGVKINSKYISIKFGNNYIVKNGEISKKLNLKKINNYLKNSNIDLFVKAVAQRKFLNCMDL